MANTTITVPVIIVSNNFDWFSQVGNKIALLKFQ